MPARQPSTRKVFAKAIPALILIALVFISAMMLASQTKSLPLVMLLWLVIPFFALWLFRKLQDLLS